MAQPIDVAMAADLDLPDGYILQWAAINQSTGADVAGVKVKNVSIFGTLLGTGATQITDLGPLMLVPGPGA